MSSAAWYWHRLRAMDSAELAAHGRRKVRQLTDRFRSSRRFAGIRELPEGSAFPQLPAPDSAPPAFRAALSRDVTDILHGRWIAFGHLQLQVDDPPQWHKDYLAGVNMATDKPALKLHHRLEGEADIKLIWEPSRWYSLVRLAQGAYILRDQRAANACLAWLQHWVASNPPYFGWNWTSALETGLRLIQFTWIDALLTGAMEAAPANSATGKPAPQSAVNDPRAALARVRAQMLLPHLWFTWRDRSFGSSANNHLIGELAGLIVAFARWPDLTRWAAPLAKLQVAWETEVLRQFATDGGNREQALNYHLFTFEFCWLARLALLANGRSVLPEAEDRLRTAANYFSAVQTPRQQWDYGDSDSAYVTPFFADWKNAASEWRRWFEDPAGSPSIRYWIGEPPKPLQAPSVVSHANGWRFYPDSGFAVCAVGDWFLRWDLSPLGYLATASHGHCDALHLSIWHRGEPIVIDPGTGSYHHDRPLRDYLSSWAAHNGPHPANLAFPERRGAFLWSAHHEKPRWRILDDLGVQAELTLPTGVARRKITRLPAEDGWQIDDAFEPADPQSGSSIEVFWQLPPRARLTLGGNSVFNIESGDAIVDIELNERWTTVNHGCPNVNDSKVAPEPKLRGSCSPAFRLVEVGPWLLLHGPASSEELRTTFRAPSPQTR